MQIDTRPLLSAILGEYPDCQAVYLFGSRADGTARPNSDVDVALLLAPAQAKTAGALTLGALHQTLVDLLRSKVDLVNLRRASTVLAAEIVTTAQRLHCADEFAADNFEMQAMTRYQHLCRERREIVAAGLADGFYETREA